MFLAHKNEDTVQTLRQHSLNTAVLSKNYAIEPLKKYLFMAGLLHDVGKYQDKFQRRINGENVKVEHSTCGSLAAEELFKNNNFLYMLQIIIMGHHSGIPDFGFPGDTEDMPTFYGRKKRAFEEYSYWKNEFSEYLEDLPDEKEFFEFLTKDCSGDQNKLIDKFAFFTRYCFSCLTDADSIDTSEFMNSGSRGKLQSDFMECLNKINSALENFHPVTLIQKKRAVIQNEVFQKTDSGSEISLIDMPTGSGKTLCSLKYALERAIRSGKKRIIYVIPYNSIIDQTYEVFSELLGSSAEILRHQSTFSYDESENEDQDFKFRAKYSAENWDADFIVTTAVQFFESIYSNKRGKLRKLHNMAESVIIFDEVHLMPLDYLQPCLQSIAYISKYLSTEIVFLSATMPDFKELFDTLTGSSISIRNLISDKSNFEVFNKCDFRYIGEISEDQLVENASHFGSTLLIVNRKSDSQLLYKNMRGNKFCLSTYIIPKDRKTIINSIKNEINQLFKEFPLFTDIPEERKIVVVSTSLIEAGVDLDFQCVFRELNGLDNILQAGGRCNREGRMKKGSVKIFQFPSEKSKYNDIKSSITKGILESYSDVNSSSAIKDYYDSLLNFLKDNLSRETIHNFATKINNIPFAQYSQKFNIIDSNTLSVVVPTDDFIKSCINDIENGVIVDTRKLQDYSANISFSDFNSLLQKGVVKDYGSGIYILTDIEYYDSNMGILTERKDYISSDVMFI